MKKIKKLSCCLFFISTTNISLSQDIINPYLTYTNATYPNPFHVGGPSYPINNPWQIILNPPQNYYNGEYEIDLHDFFWYRDFIDHADCANNPGAVNYTVSYQLELASFPFTNDCAFMNGGCVQSTTPYYRHLKMPQIDAQHWSYSSTNNEWTFQNWPPVGASVLSARALLFCDILPDDITINNMIKMQKNKNGFAEINLITIY